MTDKAMMYPELYVLPSGGTIFDTATRDEEAIDDWERAVIESADFSYLDSYGTNDNGPAEIDKRAELEAKIAAGDLLVVNLGDGFYALIEPLDQIPDGDDTVH